jgi:hypothetical protein
MYAVTSNALHVKTYSEWTVFVVDIKDMEREWFLPLGTPAQ